MVELRKMEAGSSDLVIDGHFMPYTRRCIPCAIDYDVIIKFESLEADSEYMIEQCQLEDVLEIKHENAAPTGPRTAQVNRLNKTICCVWWPHFNGDIHLRKQRQQSPFKIFEE